MSADHLRPGDWALLPLVRILIASVRRNGSRVTVITAGGLPIDLGLDDEVTVLR